MHALVPLVAVLFAVAVAAVVARLIQRRPKPKQRSHPPATCPDGAQGGTDIMAAAADHLPAGDVLPEFARRREFDAAYDYPFEGWKPSWVDSATPQHDDACVRECEAEARDAVRRTDGPDAAPVGNVSMRCRHDCTRY